MDLKKLKWAVLLGAVTLLSGTGSALAEEPYPSRPVTMVVPFPPGGPTDVTGRILAEKLSNELKQSVVVDNRGGASGNIGAQLVAKSPPDGYTIFFSTGGTHGINPFLYENPGYDPVKDFEPVAWVTKSPNIIVVNPDFPAKTLAELIEMAKASPEEYASAAPGQGSTPHMFGELFKRTAGIQIRHVAYRGSGPALTDVMAGHVPIIFDGIPSPLPYVKAGKLRALAVTGLTRTPSAPDIPTVAETLPGFDASGWFAVYAPAGTPRPIVAKLNKAINKILEMPEVKKRYADLGAEVVGGPPEALQRQVAAELKKWSALIKESGMKAQ